MRDLWYLWPMLSNLRLSCLLFLNGHHVIFMLTDDNDKRTEDPDLCKFDQIIVFMAYISVIINPLLNASDAHSFTSTVLELIEHVTL